jgi:hypothetical protein
MQAQYVAQQQAHYQAQQAQQAQWQAHHVGNANAQSLIPPVPVDTE